MSIILLFIPLTAMGEEQNLVTPITIGYSGAPEANVYNSMVEYYGFFEKNGLKVTPSYFPTAKETADTVMDGENDFGMVNSYSVARLLNEGKKPVILTSLLRIDEIYYITVNTNVGIATPADLQGKRIGIVPGDSWEYYLDKYMVLNGEDISSVSLVPFKNEEEVIQYLNEGKIDAGLTIYQYASALCAQQPEKFQMWSVNNFEDNYMLLISNQDTIAKKPDAVKNLIKAYADTWDYTNANMDKVQQDAVERTGLSQKQMQDLVTGLTPEISLTQGLLSTMEAQSRYLVKNGNGSSFETPDYLKSINFTFLDMVSPEGDTIIHS